MFIYTKGPGRIALAIVLLLSLAVTALSSAVHAPRARAAGTPTVTLASPKVVAGQTIDDTAANFTPSEHVLTYLVSTGPISGTLLLHDNVADATGGFVQKGLVIPASTPAGHYNIIASGATSKAVAQAPLEVTAVKAAITVTPTTFSPTDTIAVSGTGFLGGETVQFNLSNVAGTTSIVLGRGTANASGTVGPASLVIPFGVTAGALQVTATGLTSTRQASANVTVVTPAATVTVKPTTALPGDSVAISGTHFKPGEQVMLSLVALSTSASLGTVTVGANGSFTLSAARIPANTPEGTVSIVATGLTSHLNASTPIKIGAQPAHLTVTPSSVTAGNTVALAGTGYIPGETVTIILSGGKTPAVTLGGVIATVNGNISVAKLVIPAFLPTGTYRLTGFGQTSGRSSSVLVNVTAPVAGPQLSIIDPAHIAGTPFRLTPGGLAQIAGAHFPAGAKVTLALKSGAKIITLALVTASPAGAIGPLGVTIPANTPAGSYTLEALVNGASLASVPTVVAALSPSITLSTTTLVPGQLVAVKGTGYAPGEQIVLAINGAATPTTPTTVLASPTGAFTAAFVVPSTVNNGANLITAIGASSRASASVKATATLPLATTWYFPHGDTTGSNQTAIAILNPGSNLATVKLTFLYANGPEQTYNTTVGAHSQGIVSLNLAAGSGRQVSTILQSDRQVSAESTITYAGGDNTAAVGTTGPSTLWYLAEGYTNGSFSEFIHVMNPQTTFATIDVRFLPFNNRPAREVRFVLQPRSNLTIDAATYMPKQSISTIVTSDKGVVVERSMRYGSGGRGAHDKIGVSSASTIWMFAQAESSADSQTFYTVLNPNAAAPAAVTATFFDRTGKPVGTQTIVVDPLHRGNIKLNDVLPNAQVATILTSNVPVVIERPLYQGPTNLGVARSGTNVFGRNGGGLSWAFPFASTANGDQTQMFLFNPGLKPALIHADFYTASGAQFKQDYTLAPNSVSVLDTSNVTGLQPGQFGVVLKSTNGQTFIAELAVINVNLQHASSTQGISQ